MVEVGPFVLEVYRAARESGPEAFQPKVLERLRAHFPFASALWGEGRYIGAEGALLPTAACAHDIDQRFLAEWAGVQHDDAVAPILREHVGSALRVHVPSFYAPTPELAEFGRRYRIQSMTVLSLPTLDARSLQWLSLYRERPDALCSADEKRWVEALAPHLAEAWRIHRVVHPTEVGDPATEAMAVADASTGLLLGAGPRFMEQVAREWTGFDGRQLPTVLRNAWRERTGCFVHLTRRCRIDGRRSSELVYLQARARAGDVVLTPRQTEVARLYAAGLSSKQIAQRQHLSPATVRNHLAAVYAALGVHDKVALAHRLSALAA